MGALVGAVALIALAVAGALLLKRHRRGRSARVIDHPVVATEPTKGSGGGRQTIATSCSDASSVISLGARMTDPKDIVIDKDERGADLLLGEGSFGEVGWAQCLWRCEGRVCE